MIELPEGVRLRTHSAGLQFIDIEHPAASASLCLQGAQLVSYQAVGKPPLLWVSEAVDFAQGKSIRGGIPVCWPWFGAHGKDVTAPAHGFARTEPWHLVAASRDVNGVVLTLQLLAAPTSRWPYRARVTLVVSIGQSLDLSLRTDNLGDTELQLTQALHTYFAVGSITQVTIDGLAQSNYCDTLLPVGERIQRQTEATLRVVAEIDRIYCSAGPVVLGDDTQQIRIANSGCNSLVVWNPWIEKSKRLSNFLGDDYLRMMCVETANCGDDTVSIAAGGSHTLSVNYSQSLLL